MKQNCTQFAKLLSAVLIVLLAGPSLSGQSGRPADLNLAYDTAAQFWNLVSQRKRLEASRLLATEEQRSAFLGWTEPPYSQPVVEYIRFGSQRDRVVVSISVKTVGLSGVVFTRSLEQEWLYQGRRWVLNLDISENKLFTEKPLPTDDDRLLAEFKAGFRLKTTEIDIPKDAWGRTIAGGIEYEYAGPGDLVLAYVSGPDVVNVELADLQKLEPQGKIRYLIAGRQLFSTEFQPLKVQVQVGKVHQEYVIPVRWSGQPPYRWTFSPSVIEPNYTGEVKLELFNQSEEVWTAGLASTTAPWWELTDWSPHGEVRLGESIVYSFKVGPSEQPAGPRQDSISVLLKGAQPTLTIPVPYVKVEMPAALPGAPSRETLERLLRDAPAPVLPNQR